MRRERIPVEASDDYRSESSLAGSVEVKRNAPSSAVTPLTNSPRRKPSEFERIFAASDRAALRRRIAAAVDHAWRRGNPMRNERILEPQHAAARRIVVDVASEKEEISLYRPVDRCTLRRTTSVSCRAPPRLSETTDGARGPGRSMLTHRTPAARQRSFSGSGLRTPAIKQELDLLRQQGLRPPSVRLPGFDAC